MLKENIRLIKENKPFSVNNFCSELETFFKRAISKIKASTKINISESEIEDIVQDCICKMIQNDYENIRRIKEIDYFASYLMKVATHQMYYILKKEKKVERLPNTFEDDEMKSEKEVNRYIFKGDHTDYLVAEEVIFILNKFFQTIKDRKHLIIFYKKLNNVKADKIAIELDLTESNVNTIYSRIMQNLVRYFEKNNLINMNDEIMKNVYNWLIKYLENIIEKNDEKPVKDKNKKKEIKKSNS